MSRVAARSTPGITLSGNKASRRKEMFTGNGLTRECYCNKGTRQGLGFEEHNDMRTIRRPKGLMLDDSHRVVNEA